MARVEMTRGRALVAGAATVTLLALAAGMFLRLNAEQPDVCGGIPREMGGCDEDQPAFAGSTCAAVGSEYGTQLNERELEILRGPDVVEGQRRSARISATEILLTARANDYLREIGLVADCSADEFLAAAETEFTDELRAGVGRYLTELTDLPEQGYEEWRANLKRTLSIIDMEEDTPSG